MSEYTKEQTAALRAVLRKKSETIRDATDADAAELIRVLARIVEGKSIYQAFGAPGDWGYGTDIGDALSALYKTPRAVAIPSIDPDCEVSDAKK
jgi:hypothetical protein